MQQYRQLVEYRNTPSIQNHWTTKNVSDTIQVIIGIRFKCLNVECQKNSEPILMQFLQTKTLFFLNKAFVNHNGLLPVRSPPIFLHNNLKDRK